MENNYFALLANDMKKLWNGLDGAQKLGMLVLIIVTIIAATFFLSKAMEPDWVVLYSDLNEVDTISIVEGMKKNGYRYKVSEDHKSVLVPSNVRDEMRVFVAENDLIKNQDTGFELLDNMQLGSTDFKNKLTKQRIFQGELVRSIEKIQGVKYARVQLAEPERSIFDDSDEKPTASVVLVLEPGYKIKSGQVKAIKNLVAYSVPRMTPEQVFITDQNGNTLSDETSKNSTDMESFKSNLEKDTAKKVSDVLEKIVGKGNVSVQVNADIDFNSAKATIESYIPLNDEKGVGVVTSSQTETETYGEVEVSKEDSINHPEYMSDAGHIKWDLKIKKVIAYNVGYGASSLFRKLQLFEMFWHAEGMKSYFEGSIYLDNEEYVVRKYDCYGYSDKNWGKDFTSPWVWLSSNNLTDMSTGQKLENSVFDIGGGRPKIGPIALKGKLLSAFYIEGKEYEFNFSKFWTRTKTMFRGEETQDEIKWVVIQKTWRNRVNVEVTCKKEDMLLINYESPDGKKRHNRLWNGGNGVGQITLYRKNKLIAKFKAEYIGFEYGEYDR